MSHNIEHKPKYHTTPCYYSPTAVTNIPTHIVLLIFIVRKFLYIYINKIQQDATVCRYLFTVKLLYIFRVSIAPIIRNT